MGNNNLIKALEHALSDKTEYVQVLVKHIDLLQDVNNIQAERLRELEQLVYQPDNEEVADLRRQLVSALQKTRNLEQEIEDFVRAKTILQLELNKLREEVMDKKIRIKVLEHDVRSHQTRTEYLLEHHGKDMHDLIARDAEIEQLNNQLRDRLKDASDEEIIAELDRRELKPETLHDVLGIIDQAQHDELKQMLEHITKRW